MRRVKVLQALAQKQHASVTEAKDDFYPNEIPTHDVDTVNAKHIETPARDSDTSTALPRIGHDNEKPPRREFPLKSIVIYEEEDLNELDAWDPMTEDYHSAFNTLDLNPQTDPTSDITGKKIIDSEQIGRYKICNFYLKHGHCVDGVYCERVHIEPKDCDKIAQLQEVYKSKKDRICLNYCSLSPTELEPNQENLLLVSVTMLRSPCDFYIVCPYDKMNFAEFTQDEIKFYIERVPQSSILKNKLQKCHEQLAGLFDHNYRIDNLKDPIYRGQIVACKLDDGRFCRAEVIEVENLADDRYTYRLFLIDIGIEVELIRESIYDIKAQSLSEPPMAQHCRLGLKAADSLIGWTPAALELFSEHAVDKKYLLCRILEESRLERSQLTIDLIDIHDHSSTTERLLASHYALPF